MFYILDMVFRVSVEYSNILYSPRNTNGKNVNEVSSASAFLIYMSVNLYGAKIYKIPAIIAILLFLVIFFTHKYMKYPDKKTTKNINNLMHAVKLNPNILNISGKNAVSGL